MVTLAIFLHPLPKIKIISIVLGCPPKFIYMHVLQSALMHSLCLNPQITVQNGKLGVGKPRSFIKVPWRKLRVFGFGYSAKRKTRSGKPRKTDSPSFPRTPSFRPRRCISHYYRQPFLAIVLYHLNIDSSVPCL